MNNNMIKDNELEAVVGGMWGAPIKKQKKIAIHKNCGGHIIHAIFSDCVCDKCGEHHFWYNDFQKEYVKA